MALSKEAIEKLESTLKLEAGTISAAMENEEETGIEIPELVVRSKEEEDKYLDNLKTEYKKVGLEIGIKDAKSELGLDFEGKSISDFATALQNKAIEEKKAELGEPNKKIEELSKNLETLQTTIKAKDDEILSIKAQATQKEEQSTLNQHLMAAIPDNVTLPKSDVAVLFKNNYSLGFDDNKKPVLKKDGEILKNDILEPLQIKDVVNTFVTERKFLKTAEGGTGEKDELGSAKAGSMEAFIKEMEDKGVNASSVEFNKEMMTRIANKTLEG